MPAAPAATVLRGRRVHLRPVELADFDGWREVRRRCADWLVKWEPAPPPGQTDLTDNRQAFAARCGARVPTAGGRYGVAPSLRYRGRADSFLSEGMARQPRTGGAVWTPSTPCLCAVFFSPLAPRLVRQPGVFAGATIP